MMAETLHTLLAFVATLSVLISIHEFGHFWVARRCGVKVLRFSVGFGKPLWTWTDRQGTDYCLAAIPLGGYVKMLDEREAPVPAADRHLSFNSKSVWARMAIVAAGPIANFVLAVVALWGMYILGVRMVLPQIGDVIPASPAAVAGLKPGDEIVAIDGEQTPGWQTVHRVLLASWGESKTLTLTIRAGEPGTPPSGAMREQSLAVTDWLLQDDQPDPISALGVIPYVPVVPAVIGALVADGAASRSGLKMGDRVVAANGQAIDDWRHWVEVVRAHPGQTLIIQVARLADVLDGQREQRLQLNLTPAAADIDGQTVGFIGASPQALAWPEGLTRQQQFGLFTALWQGIATTGSLTAMTLTSLWKMLVGLVSVKNLSGPITIAKVASASLQSGLANFLYFLGLLSVSLAVLNLLPIPVLDGGHLLFYVIELVRGKPLPDSVQTLGLKIGVTLVAGVMLLAVYNDIARLF